MHSSHNQTDPVRRNKNILQLIWFIPK